jgi:hypothetical protein
MSLVSLIGGDSYEGGSLIREIKMIETIGEDHLGDRVRNRHRTNFGVGNGFRSSTFELGKRIIVVVVRNN